MPARDITVQDPRRFPSPPPPAVLAARSGPASGGLGVCRTKRVRRALRCACAGGLGAGGGVEACLLDKLGPQPCPGLFETEPHKLNNAGCRSRLVHVIYSFWAASE